MTRLARAVAHDPCLTMLHRQEVSTDVLSSGTLCDVLWKPIVWHDADHYPQWHSYPTRAGTPPRQGAELMLAEHPGRTFVATTVEAGTDPVIVWLRPLRDLDSF
jgi:hypothetical protein